MSAVMSMAAVAFLGVVLSSGVILLVISVLTLGLAVVYARTRGADPSPVRRWHDAELPRVTVQLPIRNEGALAVRVVRAARARNDATISRRAP